MVPFAQVTKSPDSATCISCKFGHQLVPLSLVTNFATRWHYLHWSKIWPPGWLDESHALPHCLGLSYWHYQLVLAWYLHQPETHQLSFTNLSDSLTTGPIDRTPGTPGSDNEREIYLKYLDADKLKGKSIWNIWTAIKWERKFQKP